MISRRIVSLLCAGLSLLGGARAATAQSPEVRLRLQLLRDSLDGISSASALRGLEQSTIEVARVQRDDAVVHVRLGLIALRLHAVDSTSHVDDAIGEFEWAATLQPTWPWPWFGLGLAESEAKDRARSFGGGVFFMLGLDRDTRAGAAFSRAIAADPSFVDGLVAFARTARRQRIGAPLQPALDALRGATVSPIGWHPDLLMERGRLERLTQHPDSAIRMFTLALLLGRRPDMAWLELARTLPLGTGKTALRVTQETAYYTGASLADREVVAMYRRDIEPIATDSQLLAFDSLSASMRADWLRTFWSTRDVMDLRAPGARLGEHFRRWDVAQRQFRLPPFRRLYDYGTERYRSGDSDLDDRGIIWLRHGAPAVRIEWPKSRNTPRSRNGADIPPNYGNESWRYDRADGALVLHFVAETDPQDYRVVETPMLLDVPGDVIALRANELPGVARLLRVNEESAAWGWISEDVRLRGRRSVGVATRTDSWERTYPVSLGGRAQWLAVGARGGRPLLHLVYAVDAAALRALPGADTLHSVPIKVRAVALDREGRPIGSLDTVQAVAMPSAASRLVAMRVDFPVEPGMVRVRLGVEVTPHIGAMYPVDSLVVPSVTGDSLALSALLLGVRERSLPWAASADTAWLDANGVFSTSDTVVVYGEAYGIRPDVPATVRLRVSRQRTGVARLLGGSSTEIALTEQVRLDAPSSAIRREVALGRLRPGSYTLELHVEQGNRRIIRRRGLTIR